MQAVTLPRVAPDLLTAPKPPRCDVAPGPDEAIASEALGASNRCWKAAHASADRRLAGLQAAVRVREAKAAELAKAGSP